MGWLQRRGDHTATDFSSLSCEFGSFCKNVYFYMERWRASIIFFFSWQMWLYCFALFGIRTREIFCEILLLGCNFNLTASKCIQSPWWCWRKTSSFGRCASIWSPNSETVFDTHIILCPVISSWASPHESGFIKKQKCLKLPQIWPTVSLCH